MTNPNGWPGKPGVPLNPETDGAHWIIGWKGKLFVAEWDAMTEDWSWGGGGESAGGVAELGWGYAGPCLTPAEVEAREATAQWGAFDEVLFWINAQPEKLISKGALYEEVMEMRPRRCMNAADENIKVAMKEAERLRALLVRWLSATDSGSWREVANLSPAAHPVADDTREALASIHTLKETPND